MNDPTLKPSANDEASLSLEPSALVGQVVAERYAVKELLGVGGMGCVYRAEHIHIRKEVALKTLHASMLRSPEIIARFEREAIAAARIAHPNVVVATDFGRFENGQYYLILELVRGRTVREELDAHSQFDVQRICSIARQVASALFAAHEVGVVHRDLKPENIMLVRSATAVDLVKVLDFGIAKMTLEGKNQTLTQLGAVFGTPQYMSPEQAGGKAIDARSDIYSLGIIIYEMLTGKLPFDAADALGFLIQHLNHPPLPLPDSVPQPLRELVHAMLAKSPDQRPASARVVVAELERISRLVGMDGVLGRALAGQAQRLNRPLRIGRLELRVSLWLGLLVVLLGGMLGIGRWSSNTASSVVDTARSAPAEEASTQLPTLAATDAKAEVERIEAIKAYQRTEQDWMLLARASVKTSHFEQAALAYQAVLSLRPDFRHDTGLLHDLLEAAQDPKAFRIVVNLAESVLERHGVDLIWELWQEQRIDPARKEQAEKLAKKLVILSHSASPALRIAIDLTFTTSCEKLLAVLGRAASDADQRSIARLQTLSRKDGCGEGGRDDCYPCLRVNDLLTKASARAAATKAPTLGHTPED
ncbi:MAG TPA: serine/threonine-protein kinase [Polyangiaceae bacterium]